MLAAADAATVTGGEDGSGGECSEADVALTSKASFVAALGP